MTHKEKVAQILEGLLTNSKCKDHVNRKWFMMLMLRILYYDDIKVRQASVAKDASKTTEDGTPDPTDIGKSSGGGGGNSLINLLI